MQKFIIIAIASCLLIPAGCKSPTETQRGDEGPEYVFRFAHEESPDSVQNDYAEAFKEKIEKKTDGRVVVEIYPVGQLGDATQQAEQLQIGAIDFAIVSPGNTGTMVPENQLFVLHFLFSDNMEVNQKVLNESDALDQLSQLYEEKNIKVLDYWTEGFQQWTSNNNISEPADFSGLKFRTIPSPLLTASYEAYGANPTPMAYEEVYSGLQLNMIDGQENPFFAVEEMNFHEVQNYLIDSRHALYATTTAVNPDYYESLPEDIQDKVDDTIEELAEESFKIQEKRNEEALESIQSDNEVEITELSDEERNAFREKSQQVFDTYKEEVGQDGAEILDELQKEIEHAENVMEN
ncbi:DctP family TRAP transporter solute-binding subunit [Alteribacillus sp. YIM 98480]|uniref:DctP family TRAP transporter solute-binding subunit n=1 Tax=Alteribacillus sp. YIM 98480 TaxID=2606599 RepID=UPI00131D0331|nr:DctP family TRAP transporter solute-binding subunit [Alteribacillus sp. YIM 98480]